MEFDNDVDSNTNREAPQNDAVSTAVSTLCFACDVMPWQLHGDNSHRYRKTMMRYGTFPMMTIMNKTQLMVFQSVRLQ